MVALAGMLATQEVSRVLPPPVSPYSECGKIQNKSILCFPKKAAAELNEAVGDSYLSHTADDESEEDEEDEGGAGFDFL